MDRKRFVALLILLPLALALCSVSLSIAATAGEYVVCELPESCQAPDSDFDRVLCESITGQYPITINFKKSGEFYGPVCNFDEIAIVIIYQDIPTLVYKDEIEKIDYSSDGTVYIYTGAKEERVEFHHKAHADKLGCDKCHFGVYERIVFDKKEAHGEACLDCHEKMGGPTDCDGCHVPHDAGQKCKDCHFKK